MILFIVCAIACLLFTLIMVGGVLWKREAFLHEYAPTVQQRYLALKPDRASPEKTRLTLPLIAAKLGMCALFIIVLTGLVYLTGATDPISGTLSAYVIWFVVNWYDVFALDLGVFAHWKKVRLPGTEDMDAEYTSNARKHITDGLFGTVLGIPISVLCGWLLSLIV